MTGVLIKKGIFGQRHTSREDDVKTQGEDGLLQAKKPEKKAIL